MRPDDDGEHSRPCVRCGAQAFYWPAAIVPGNPLAPRGSRESVPQPRPAWQCISCGHLEPVERRARPTAQRTM